jgi:hypothetical protein
MSITKSSPFSRYACSLALFGACLSSAWGADIGSVRDLGLVIEQATQCKPEALRALDPGNNPEVQKNLTRLGVKLGAPGGFELPEEGVWEFHYNLPVGVRVFGHETTFAKLAGYSDMFFLTEFPGGQAELDKLKDALSLNPVRAAMIEQFITYYTYKPEYYRQVVPAGQEGAAAVVAGLERMNGRAYIVVGCYSGA